MHGRLGPPNAGMNAKGAMHGSGGSMNYLEYMDQQMGQVSNNSQLSSGPQGMGNIPIPPMQPQTSLGHMQPNQRIMNHRRSVGPPSLPPGPPQQFPQNYHQSNNRMNPQHFGFAPSAHPPGAAYGNVQAGGHVGGFQTNSDFKGRWDQPGHQPQPLHQGNQWGNPPNQPHSANMDFRNKEQGRGGRKNSRWG